MSACTCAARATRVQVGVQDGWERKQKAKWTTAGGCGVDDAFLTELPEDRKGQEGETADDIRCERLPREGSQESAKLMCADGGTRKEGIQKHSTPEYSFETYRVHC